MKTEMVMPQMGESIAEATILKWHKKIGDNVKKDETILEISTDKVDSEIPAPASGVLVELKAIEGQTVAVKSVIAVIDSEGGAAVKATTNGAAKSAPVETKAEAKKEATKLAPAPVVTQPSPTANPAPQVAVTAHEIPRDYGNKFLSPVARNVGAAYGMTPTELASIPGSGVQGRVTKTDVMTYAQFRDMKGGAPSKKSLDLPAAPQLEYGPDGTRREKMDNMRKRIAEHMVRSKATSAHVYSTAEVDVTNIVKWRERVQSQFQAREGFKLTMTPPFLEAAIKALIAYPHVNASVEGDEIVLKKNVNLGCAVALGNTGLIVPVIKNSETLSLTGIASSLNDLAQRARNKKLNPDDTQGGTFTVTNPGVFGNIIGNPIINQPQLAILSIGAVKKRPMVVNDAIAIRDMVYLTLSYDHRVIDGSLGGMFLQYVTKYLEAWEIDRELY
ncbi:2-oxo acid dehydrogenase subunit E2 [bacterium]|nr:2-oxo acid dehydrogenase subunit E2 [bacterium]